MTESLKFPDKQPCSHEAWMRLPSYSAIIDGKKVMGIKRCYDCDIVAPLKEIPDG